MTVEVNAIETVVELPRLAQSEEPGGTGGEARGRGRSYELNGMGGVRHEDYYPRLCDRSRRRRDDRFWALGALHSDQGKRRSTQWGPIINLRVLVDFLQSPERVEAPGSFRYLREGPVRSRWMRRRIRSRRRVGR